MTKKRWVLIGVAAGVLAAGIGGGVAVAGGVADRDTPITGPALAKAEAAALAYTGAGKVTETEVGDEDSYYEVEVTLPGGRRVDVQLDANFTVVSSTMDDSPDDTDGGAGND